MAENISKPKSPPARSDREAGISDAGSAVATASKPAMVRRPEESKVMRSEKILVVEDENLVRWALTERLKAEGYQVFEADGGESARAIFKRRPLDLAILDYRLPDTDGVSLLKEILAESPDTIVLMVTAFGSIDSAVAAIKLGAYDYLSKPFNMDEMMATVSNALETTRLRREVKLLREEQKQRFGLDRLVGRSSKMKDVLKLVEKISKSDATTVLLQGESGTGKSLIARAIHFNSRRVDKPFMTITCTALPETLLESELLGHEKGSFTDAKTQKKGLFEMADGGTVFLDEIGDISLPFQAKLLTFLEEKTFKRVGGTTDIQVDVRIIAATNRDLETAVAEHRFRSDLYYRLKVIPILIPPLRDRREDVAPLVASFTDSFARDFRKKITAIDDAAMSALEAYSWPGNIRELRNVIERAVLLSETDRLTLDDLPSEIRENRPAGAHTPAAATAAAPAPAGAAAAAASGMPIFLPASGVDFEEVEKELVKQALARTGGNQTRAATLLGMNRDQIRYRIEKFGLRNPAES